MGLKDALTLGPAKEIASIFLLPDCNMACRFCASELDFSVMTWEQAEQLLLLLRKRGLRNVVLGGGEPFLWPHGLLDLCARAKALGFLVQVCTNATRLPVGYEQAEAIDRFVLPLEAMDPLVHDALRLHSGGHHGQVLAVLEKLRIAERPVTLSTVVTRANLALLPDLAAFLRELHRQGARLHAWHLYRFLPVGRAGRPNAEQLDLPLEAFLTAARSIQGLGLAFPVYRRSDMLKATSVAYFWAEEQGLQGN
jgi:MoaA/NifB/PqqE/SkfB family radical SAM enzyme